MGVAITGGEHGWDHGYYRSYHHKGYYAPVIPFVGYSYTLSHHHYD